MNRKKLALVVAGLAFTGIATAAQVDDQVITFDITGASSIAVGADITLTVSGTATPLGGGITYTGDSDSSTTLAYTSVTGNPESIAVSSTGAHPSGTALTIVSSIPVGTNACGSPSPAISFPLTGEALISGIDNGISCTSNLTYDLTITTSGAIDPSEDNTSTTVTFTLSET